jgi:hypothetical protein
MAEQTDTPADDLQKDRGDIATRFQKGNDAWKARSKHGRNPIHTPETLLEAIAEYLEWVEAHPLYEEQVKVVDKCVETVAVSKPRAMTISACARFCGVTYKTWDQWRKHPDFSEIVEEADEIIREQKFEGAAAGLFNANIIARDLGLREASDSRVKHSGGIGLADLSSMTDEELMEIVAGKL